MTIDPYTHHGMDELKSAYADAMWGWVHIEAIIFSSYAAALGVLQANIEPARSAFFAINSFEARLLMTNAAIKQRWEKNPVISPYVNFSEWDELFQRCREASKQRGSIAHLTGARVNPDKPHQKQIFLLLEPPSDPRHPITWGEAKSRGVDAKKLNEFNRDWKNLYRDLSVFAIHLWLAELPLTSSLQQSDQDHPLHKRRPRTPKVHELLPPPLKK
jgi:hypothetical protein